MHAQVAGKMGSVALERAHLGRSSCGLRAGSGQFHASFDLARAAAWKAAPRTDNLWMHRCLTATADRD